MDHLSAAAQSAMLQASAADHPSPTASTTNTTLPPSSSQTQPSAPLAVPTAEETIKAIVQSQGYAFLDRYVALHNLLTPFQQQHATLDHLFDLVVRHYENQSLDESDVLLKFKAKVAHDRKSAGSAVPHTYPHHEDPMLKAERKGPPMRMMDYGHPYYQQYAGVGPNGALPVMHSGQNASSIHPQR